MGNWQWQARVCCKGETSLNEEIRLAAGKASSFRPSVDLHGSEGELPKTGPRLACRSEAPGTAPTLVLKILSSTALPANSALRITAEGYEYSLRDARDGMTFFGCKKRSHGENSLKGDILNDVIMPLTDKEAAEKHRGRQFEIAYKPAQLSYWIRDLGVGFGVFLRLDEKARLRDNTLINIGEAIAQTSTYQTARQTPTVHRSSTAYAHSRGGSAWTTRWSARPTHSVHPAEKCAPGTEYV